MQAPEGEVAYANCFGGRIASIRRPTFGRMDGNGRACNATTSYTVVRDRCLGLPSCAVPASNSLFGDPVRDSARRCAASVSEWTNAPCLFYIQQLQHPA